MVPQVPSNTQALYVWGKLNHSYGLLLPSHCTERQSLPQTMRATKIL